MVNASAESMRSQRHRLPLLLQEKTGGRSRAESRGDIHLAGTIPEERASPTFPATVEVVESLGARAIVTLRAAEDLHLRAVVDGRDLENLREGEKLEFVLDLRALHLFGG